MRAKKFLAFILCFVMVFSIMPAGMTALAAGPEPQDNGTSAPDTDGADSSGESQPDEYGFTPVDTKLTMEPTELTEESEEGLYVENVDPELVKLRQQMTIAEDEPVRVIIFLDEQSVIERNNSTVASISAISQADSIEAGQEEVISSIEQQVLDGGQLDVHYQYSWLLNGVAATIRYGDIPKVESVDGVRSVAIQRRYHTTSADVPAVDDPYGIMPITNSDGPMIGREDVWKESGFLGAGMKIAVIDTGLDLTHPSFGPLEKEQLTDDSVDEQTISLVLSSLHAQENMPGVTAEQLYRSTKVPYAFNYIDRSLDVSHKNDTQGDHGTHVAGIAAANILSGTDVVGVAPYAQLFVMKVFGSRADGGAYDEDVMAAIEDAMKLGADVINLSLGIEAGFTTDGKEIDDVYDLVGRTGTILTASAGNAAAMGENNFWNSGSNLTSDPDNSLVGSPSTYSSALSVASVNNIGQTGYYLEVADSKYIYLDDSAQYGHRTMLSLVGGSADESSYEITAVPNCGKEQSDFTGASGTIALVQRGETNFYNKCQLAEAAGAIACVIYNNTSGTIGLDLTPPQEGAGKIPTIPCVSITKADGEAIIAAKSADPSVKMMVSDDVVTVGTDDGYTMSEFSSWGVAPDLTLKPDITAPGGNIYSTLDDGEYGTMSGTSMAAPNLAGIAALVTEYIKTNYPELAGEDLSGFVNGLLMSTAVPLRCGGLYYSPRQQGAGLANAAKAVAARAVLTVDGNTRPKAELKDDPDKTGKYQFTVGIKNFGKEPLYYELPETVVQTEAVTEPDPQTDKKFMAMAPQALDASVSVEGDYDSFLIYDYEEDLDIDSHDAYIQRRVQLGDRTVFEAQSFRYDLLEDGKTTTEDVQAYLDELVRKDVTAADGDDVDLWAEVACVKAGDTVPFTVTIQVSENGKKYMDDNFENGIYVDGFTFFNAKAGGVDLSMPFLAFYGDWTQAPILDSAFYWDAFGSSDVDDDVEPTGSQTFNVLWTKYATFISPLGVNPYVADDMRIDPAHISLSPGFDGNMDKVDDIYVSLMRNAKSLTVTYLDENGELIAKPQVAEHVRKSFYRSSAGQVYPYSHAGLDIAALLGAPTDEAGAPFHTAGEAVPRPIGLAAHVAHLGQCHGHNIIIAYADAEQNGMANTMTRTQ